MDGVDLSSIKGNADYWQRAFPWDDVFDRLLGGPAQAGVAHNYVRADGGGSGVARRPTYTSASQWKRALASDSTLSLHAAVAPERYVVFDLDLRDHLKLQPCPNDHPITAICPRCWEALAQPAVTAVDLFLRKLCFQLPPNALLAVFSGGNGLHLWLRVPPAMAQLAGRRELRPLLKSLVETKEAKQHLRELLPVLANVGDDQWPLFDWDVTTGAAAQLHAHLIKLPWSLHNRTRLPAVPLPISRTPDGAASVPYPLPITQQRWREGCDAWLRFFDSPVALK
jgi:hypothetical protein